MIEVTFTLWNETDVYSVCIKNCPVKLNMLFGWWFTDNVALGAQIIEIKKAGQNEEHMC
jgi:hypothetical protein